MLQQGRRHKEVLDRAIHLVGAHFDAHQIDESHGLSHALSVLYHAKEALANPPFQETPARKQLAICLAALLHDCDDAKYFDTGTEYFHALRIVKESGGDEDLASEVAHMVSLVSTRNNKNSTAEPLLLVPRHSDRLEALGQIGIQRCLQYAEKVGNALYTENTARCRSTEELKAIATPERFAAYQGDSDSVIDHFYDKLLHLRLTADMTPSVYLLRISEERHALMESFVLDTWRNAK